MKQCRNASIVKGAILNLNEIFRLVQENLEYVIMDSFFKFRKCDQDREYVESPQKQDTWS